MKTLAQMADEVRRNSIDKGWREVKNPWPEYVALLHSEISEILEAYRDRKMASYTTAAGKPDDVGSEFADVLIRVLDMGDVYELHLPTVGLSAVELVEPRPRPQGLPAWCAWLHREASLLYDIDPWPVVPILMAVVTMANEFGIDLEREFDRKMAYNVTRPYRHGGRVL